MDSVQTRLSCQKRFDQPPGKDWMVIPDQHDLPWNCAQELLEKHESALAVERAVTAIN
jgi:hypothetical protein